MISIGNSLLIKDHCRIHRPVLRYIGVLCWLRALISRLLPACLTLHIVCNIFLCFKVKECREFCYPGSVVTNDEVCDREVNIRFGKANAVFARPSNIRLSGSPGKPMCLVAFIFCSVYVMSLRDRPHVRGRLPSLYWLDNCRRSPHTDWPTPPEGQEIDMQQWRTGRGTGRTYCYILLTFIARIDVQLELTSF